MMKKLIKIFAMPPLFALLFIGGLQAFQAASSASPSARKTGFIGVGETKLYYEELGTGVPLIMAHGGLLDCSMWDGQFEEFARLFRVIRYDARGDGKSPDVEGKYSNFEDLKKLMDGLGIQKAILIGLSKGGRTAADFAIAHAQMVEALVLVAPGLSGHPFDSPELQKTYTPLTEAYKKGDSELIVELFMRSWTDGPRRSPSDVDSSVRDKVKKMGMNNMLKKRLKSTLVELDPPALGRLAEIKAPTLAVVGNLDMPDILDIVERIAGEVPGARKVVIPDVAHMVNLEKPAEFNRVVLEFLAPYARK
jgi:pimeloyl-ACP methyl ester carboxylesterase